jgi:hypothetical protein
MRLRDGLTHGLALAGLSAAIFAIGGSPRWAQALVAVIVALALVTQLLSRRSFARVSPLVAMLGIAVAATALQLLPIGSLAGALDPVGVGLRDDGASLLGFDPSQTATLDVPGTIRGLAFFVILLGVALVALRYASSERGRYQLLAAIGVLCGLCAVVVGIHALIGADSLYGLYRPQHASPPLLGPLLNENHLGCLMAVGTVTALGLVLYRRQPSWLRACWVVVVAMCGAVTLVGASRGATLALGAGVVVVGAVRLAQKLVANAPATTSRRRGSRLVTSSVPIAAVAASAVVVVLYASAGNVTDQLERTTMRELDEPASKFGAMRSAVDLIEEAPWTGVGRGAFEPAFTRVHPPSAVGTMSHLENEYVQAVVDWGIPVAILLALAGGWLAVTAVRRWRDGPLAAGALGAVVIVGLQSNVDFGLELLGVAVPITAIAATLAYAPMREGSRRLPVSRVLRIAIIGALALGAVALLTPATRTIDEDHEQLEQLSHPDLVDVLPSIERHPLDYYGYAVAAQALQRSDDPRTIPVLNHALRLHPTHPQLHLVTARLLLAAGHPEQASVEYVAAMRGTRSRRRLLEEVVARLGPKLAAEAIPTEELRADDLQFFEERHRVDIAALYLAHVLDAHPDDFHACAAIYDIATRYPDLDVVAATHHCPHYELTRQMRLRIGRQQLAHHADADAIQLLADVESWPGRIDEKFAAWMIVCDAHADLREWDDAKHCLRRLDASGIATTDGRAEIANRVTKLDDARRESDTADGPAR